MRLLRRATICCAIAGTQAELDEEMDVPPVDAVDRQPGSSATPRWRARTPAASGSGAGWRRPGRTSRYAVRSMRRQPAFAIAADRHHRAGHRRDDVRVRTARRLVVKSLPVERPHRLVWFREPGVLVSGLRARFRRACRSSTACSAGTWIAPYVDWSGSGRRSRAADVLEATGEFFSDAARACRDRPHVRFERHGRRGHQSRRVAAPFRRPIPPPSDAPSASAALPLTIVGVAPAGFFGVAPGLAARGLRADRRPASPRIRSSSPRPRHGCTSWRRLKDGVSHTQADAALQTRLAAGHGSRRRVRGCRPTGGRRILGRKTALEAGRTGYSPVREPVRRAAAGPDGPGRACCWPSPAPASRICCSRAASRGEKRSRSGWPSARSARACSASSSPNRSSSRWAARRSDWSSPRGPAACWCRS